MFNYPEHPETTAWPANYLSERIQKTYANSQLSSAANIKCGVPQGSSLGPMLYLIYVSDVSSILKHCSMKLYADDKVIYASADSPNDALKLVQNELDEFTVWCNANKLSISTDKTKVMLFGSRNIVKNTQLPNLLLMTGFTLLMNTHILEHTSIHFSILKVRQRQHLR